MVAAAGGIDGPFAGGQIALIGKKVRRLSGRFSRGRPLGPYPPYLTLALPLQ